LANLTCDPESAHLISLPQALERVRVTRHIQRGFIHFRFSLRLLFAAVTLVAIGVAGWQSYSYLAQPYREAEAERLIAERIPAEVLADRDHYGPFFLHGAIGQDAIRGSSSWLRWKEGSSTSISTAWRWADRRPVTGLQITGTDLSDLEPDIFTRFAHLTHVRIQPIQLAKFNDEQLILLCSMPTLRSVRIHSLRIPPAAIERLAQNTELRSLDLNSTTLTDQEAMPLAKLVNLEMLDLTGTKVSDKGVEYLVRHMPKLRSLCLDQLPGQSQITDRCCEAISELAHLEELSVSHSQITDDGLLSLARSPSLAWLTVNGTRITPVSIDTLCHMMSLKYVNVNSTRASESATLRRLVRPGLRIYPSVSSLTSEQRRSP
jgi:hypothetical protein